MANNPAPGNGNTERDEGCEGGRVPLGIQRLASHGDGPQAIFIPCQNEDERIVIVAEPGYDPAQLWRELCDFMDAEGIPHA